MLKPAKRWSLIETNQEEVKIITKENEINSLVAKVLSIRGVKSRDQVKSFLNIEQTSFYDPFLLNGMLKTVEKIQSAIIKKEKILIYGDYDADGVTSTAIIYKTLKLLNADFAYYIPNRFEEGYGLNKEALQKAATKGFKLIITVDTGISAVEEAKLAKELGLTLIITDHHEPPEVLPEAYTIINPKKPGDSYPYTYLAGVGVAFKLAHALLGRPPIEFLDLVALGTIADLVPLLDENRLIVSLGLKQLNKTVNVGLKSMLERTGLTDKQITASHIGFIIAPRINASGRLENANLAVKLLITNVKEEAEKIVEQLNEINKERQSLVEQITKEALAIIEAENMQNDQVLVIAKEGWNEGVIGIVASRILEKYYRPTIILSINSEEKHAKGSARSISGYDIFQALSRAKDILPKYGGHPAAAGLSISIEDINHLRAKLIELAKEWLSPEDYQPIEKVDAVCRIDDINTKLINELESLAPFGIGNPSPKIIIEQTTITDIRALGNKNQHLKLMVKGNNNSLEALIFKRGELIKDIAKFSEAELLGELTINEWLGKQKPQITVRDIHIKSLQIFDWRSNDWLGALKDVKRENSLLLYNLPSIKENIDITNQWNLFHYDKYQDFKTEVNELILLHLPPSLTKLKEILKAYPQLERIYCIFSDNNATMQTVLKKETFKQVYIALKQQNSLKNKGKAEHYFKELQINSETFLFILDVFVELGFIIIDGNQINFKQNPEKKDLTESKLFREYQEQAKLSQLLLSAEHHKLKSWFIKQYLEYTQGK